MKVRFDQRNESTFLLSDIKAKPTKNGDGEMLQFVFVNEEDASQVSEFFVIKHKKSSVSKQALARLKDLIVFSGFEIKDEFDVTQLLMHRYTARTYYEGDFEKLEFLSHLGVKKQDRMEDVPF